MCLQDVMKIKKKISKTTPGHEKRQEIIELLKKLETFKINLEVLQKSDIGLTINTLRKTSKDNEIVDICRKLVKRWKKLLPSHTQKCGSGSSTCEPKKEMESIRHKCRQMLTTALSGHTSAVKLAEALEEAIFSIFKNTDIPYRNRIRSRISNLTNKNNVTLRKNFCDGVITPSQLAVMTAEEMASDEMKQLRERFLQESINSAQLPTIQETKTEMIQCGKCKSRNCSYTQQQILSADEPMTTFAACHKCGKRWMC